VSEAVPPSTTIADVLLMHGTPGCLTPPLRTVSAPTTPVCGRAVTVRLQPGSREGGFDALYALLSEDLHGAVVVVAGMAEVPGAVWGQILSRAAAHRGAVGACVDGAVRDVSLLDAERLALWATTLHTAGAPGQAHVAEVGGTVRIGGVEVAQGDVIVGDAAGAVRLPQRSADTVLHQAHALAVAEERVLEELAAGVRLNQAYHHKRSAQAAITAELREANGIPSRQGDS
jgi:regulator of RNase E activity RraA